ncbi:WD40-repeat-containing domain protein [Hyaloraphidium curvatum]|nr:WD40-repeat-containing domain protein [Hyaloraphidium curvatum]
MAAEDGDLEGYLSEDDVIEVIAPAEDGAEEPLDDLDMDGGDVEDEGDLEGQDDAEEQDPDGMEETGPAEPTQDDSCSGFFRHKGSVFSVALSPTNENLACSGGEDDVAWLWKVDSGEDLFQLEGHSDSVIDVAFNCDGKFVATAGMDGKVLVWSTSDGKQVTALQAGTEITWINWHPRGNVLLAGTSDFTIWMWAIPSGTVMNVFSGHAAPVTCGQFTPDGKTVVSGSEDGECIVWDPKTAQPVRKLTAQDQRWHQEGVTCMAVNSDNTLLLTGSSDGRAILTHLGTGRLLASFEGHTESVEAVGFSPVMGLAATAGTDGKLMLWDLATFRLRKTCQHEVFVKAHCSEECLIRFLSQDAITRLRFHPATPLVTTASADRTIRTWDSRTGQCESTMQGHSDTILDLVLSKDGRTAVSGSDDGTALVFRLS